MHPLVRDVAVLGLPHVDWGEKVVAVIVAPEALDLSALRHDLRATLAAYKAPKRMLVADALPTTRYGKIDKKHLRSDLAQLEESKPL